MFSGFDFGTSNCAVGVMQQNTGESKVRLLEINNGQPFMPSALYARRRELICESAALLMQDKSSQDDYMKRRSGQLDAARRVRRQEDIRSGEKTVFVGQEAFDQYLSSPGEGYFVKSVKSFLGGSGLPPAAVQFFEDIVTTMMLTVKQRSEQSLQQEIHHTVIGRPINFQGVHPQQSNRRAIDILTTSAKRAGFKSIEFLYEPLAAGMDFEQSLQDDTTVLIVDVGGGTTDCSMVRMGPSYRNSVDRAEDFLGHSGDRIGGNDFDIAVAGKLLMPLLGMQSTFKDGLPIPTQVFWSAVKTNNVGEQTLFNSAATEDLLSQYRLKSAEPEILQRFIRLHQERKNHQLVRSAEQAKIMLSESHSHDVDLGFVEETLSCCVSREAFSRAVKDHVGRVTQLIDEVVAQAQCEPDLIYITGGAAKSQIIRQVIETKFSNVDVVDGDHFGSVTKGLTVWSERLFS
ncbi:MAG: molecular chaperone [Cellvibrionaceae bacterium]